MRKRIPINPDGNVVIVAPFEYELLNHFIDERGIEVLYKTTADKLYQDDDGRVIGVLAFEEDGSELKIGTRQGVLLAAGGFDHNADMRQQYLYAPIYASLMTAESTGDGHRMGMEVGADLANMSAVYGGNNWLTPKEDGTLNSLEGHDSGNKRGKPFSFMVNKKGVRVADESGAYGTFQQIHANWDNSMFTWANIPLYWIGDQTYADRYGIMAGGPGEVADWIFKADTIEEIADHYGINKESLVAETAKYNGYTATGIDEDFHRGEYIFDIANCADNDAGLVNGCLGPVEKPPYYASEVWPGSVGTSGGLHVNGKSQVLDTRGEIIPGLYAAGCNAASFSGMSYAGGGTAVGSACVFSWIAGKYLAEE